MKIAFISDIHGNAVALDAVLEDLAGQQVDRIYVLGDLCYRGPEPKRALNLIRQLNTPVIKGNADEWVVRGVQPGEVPDQALDMMNRERAWTVEQLDQEDIQYLQNLPMDIHQPLSDKLTLHAFHATPENLFTIVFPDASPETLQQSLMYAEEAELYVYAHIHLPYIRFLNGKCIVNIGSVGLPFDGLPKASYALVEVDQDNFQLGIRRVAYDVERVVEQYRKADYPNADLMIQIVRNGARP